MENQKIINEVVEGEVKEAVKPLEARELNNNIILDVIIKSSKIQQAANILMDYNNSSDIKTTISPDEFKRLSELAVEQMTLLKAVVDKFADEYIKNKELKDDLKIRQGGDNANIQEPKND